MSKKLGTVYKIIPKDENGPECYVGSTTQKLKTRLTQHRNDFKQWWENNYHWVSIFHIFLLYGIDRVDIIELESCQLDQLKQREQWWISEMSIVEQRRAFMTEKQRREQQIEVNKYAYSCECGGKYTNNGRASHRRTARHKRYEASKQKPKFPSPKFTQAYLQSKKKEELLTNDDFPAYWYEDENDEVLTGSGSI